MEGEARGFQLATILTIRTSPSPSHPSAPTIPFSPVFSIGTDSIDSPCNTANPKLVSLDLISEVRERTALLEEAFPGRFSSYRTRDICLRFGKRRQGRSAEEEGEGRGEGGRKCWIVDLDHSQRDLHVAKCLKLTISAPSIRLGRSSPNVAVLHALSSSTPSSEVASSQSRPLDWMLVMIVSTVTHCQILELTIRPPHSLSSIF
jgi:hypothetical protein